MLYVGNDIVDLTLPDLHQRLQNRRFLERVFTEDERDKIETAQRPELLFWLFWAAKETAYKIVSKIKEPPVFSHRLFQASLPPTLEPITNNSKGKLEIQYSGLSLEANFFISAESLELRACYATHDKATPYTSTSGKCRMNPAEQKLWSNRAAIITSFTESERDSIRRPESALVRACCKRQIADTLQIEPALLQIIRPFNQHKSLPPYVLLDNRRCQIDVSLSHHGAQLAWIFSYPQ